MMVITYGQLANCLNDLLRSGKRGYEDPICINGEYFEEIQDKTTGKVLLKGNKSHPTSADFKL